MGGIRRNTGLRRRSKECGEKIFVPSAISVPQKPFKDPQQLAVGIVHDQLVPDVLQQFSEGNRRKTTDKRAVETVGGKEGVSWKNVGNDGERTIFAWDVGALFPRKKQSKDVSRAGKEYKVSGSRNHQPENTWSK